MGQEKRRCFNPLPPSKTGETTLVYHVSKGHARFQSAPAFETPASDYVHRTQRVSIRSRIPRREKTREVRREARRRRVSIRSRHPKREKQRGKECHTPCTMFQS